MRFIAAQAAESRKITASALHHARGEALPHSLIERAQAIAAVNNNMLRTNARRCAVLVGTYDCWWYR